MDRLAELDAMRAALEALAPLEAERRASALRWLADALEVPVDLTGSAGATPAQVDESGGNQGARRSGQTPTPKQFLLDKDPQSQIDQVACLGYYLTHYRNKPHFKTADISSLNVEAAGARLSNAAKAVSNATSSSGYFVTAGSQNKQMSALGEQVVDAMPNREAVKSILAIRRAPRKRPAKRAASAKPGANTSA